MEDEPTHSEQGRAYLAAEMQRQGISLNMVSAMAGKNAAYIQQYITRGTPRYLPEPIRDFLVKTFDLDESKLKPPPLTPKRSVADEHKDQRVPVMMTDSELKDLDDWMFARRIRSRGEAIRRLVKMGMTIPDLPG